MSLPVVLRDVAEKDLSDAFDWYHRERGGLGDKFLAAAERLFDRIANNPMVFQIVMADVRRGVVRRFPYCVYYRVHADRVEILAVMHSSRNPATWQSRI